MSSLSFPLPALRPLAAALFAVLTLAGAPSRATVATGAMAVPRMMHQASAMQDGRVLVSGGFAKPGTPAYASAEIYDPASGAFSPIAPMLTSRVYHAAVTLSDGRILAMGGWSGSSLNPTNTAEIYDPVSGQWSATGNMNVARGRTSARLLNDGRVFVMNTDAYSGVAYAEVYDPQTGLFVKTGNMVGVTGWHGLVVLADGRLLKVGGYGPQDGYSNRAEIWDPATNQWSATGSMSEMRQDFRPVLLADGKVLVAGGRNQMSLKSTEVYDPATGLFSAGAPMADYFESDSSTTLANGDLIFTGAYTKNLMHYESATGLWNVTGPKRASARETTVSRLPNGKLLLAGGAALNDATTYAALWSQACAMQKIALTSASQAVGGDGGLLSWTVTAAPGCEFETADLPAWLTPVTAAPMHMPEAGSMPVSFNAAPNMSGATRSATLLVGNNAATLTQAVSPTCPSMPTLGPISMHRSYSTQGSLTVSAAASCPWRISAVPAWVTLTSAANGQGNGSVTYTTIANTGPQRSGSGQIEALGATSTFTMSQEALPLCPTYATLTPSNLVMSASASSGSVSVSAPATCPWTVSTFPSWLTITGGSGTGNGSFSYAAPANTGAARSGSGSVTGPGVSSSFNVSQAAPPCATWSVTPSSASFPAAGTTGSFAVTAASTCNWTLGTLPSWMSTSSATSGTGNGSISYAVAANTGTARSATATLTGSGPALTLSLNQASGVVVTCGATPISTGVPVNGLLQTSACTSGARGAGYYTDRYTFNGVPGQLVTILLTSPAFDTYLYLKNPGGSVIKSDDDGGGGYNSRIPASSGSFMLPAGTSGVYTIEVTSYGQYKTGTYSLSFTQ